MAFRFPHRYFRRTILVLLVALAAWGGWLGWKRWLKPWLFPPSPLVLTPVLALEALQAKSLYYNGPARSFLLAKRPDLLTAEDQDAASPRVRAFEQAVQDPKLFRQLDRQYRFDTLLLLGDASSYPRLIEHLLLPDPDKRDFRLTYLDHWAVVFKRGAAREWQPSDADVVKQKIAGLRAEDRAAFLAKAAAKMVALRQNEAAKRWLDEALAADSSSVDALTGMADYYVWLGKWPEADAYADKALEQNDQYAPALARKVDAMRATDHKADALKFSEKLNALLPEDPVRLRQHARIAHEAGAYDKEIKTLTRLIELAAASGRPTGEYEFDLGEAHVFMAMNDATHAPLAVEHLKRALLDPKLSKEQRRFAEERLQTIRERTKLK